MLYNLEICPFLCFRLKTYFFLLSLLWQNHASLFLSIYNFFSPHLFASNPIFYILHLVDHSYVYVYGLKVRSLCKILRTLRSDSPVAAKCFLTERLGLFTIAILTLSAFSGVRTVRILPWGFLFNTEAFSRKFCTHFLWYSEREHGHDEEC